MQVGTPRRLFIYGERGERKHDEWLGALVTHRFLSDIGRGSTLSTDGSGEMEDRRW
jgi:hypothetical protein